MLNVATKGWFSPVALNYQLQKYLETTDGASLTTSALAASDYYMKNI